MKSSLAKRERTLEDQLGDRFKDGRSAGIRAMSEQVRVAVSGGVLGGKAQEIAKKMRRQRMDLVWALEPGNDELLRHAELMGWHPAGDWGHP